MKLRELKAIIDKAVENLGNDDCDPDVEVCFKKSLHAISLHDITQDGVEGTLYITVGKKLYDEDEK